MSKSGMIVAGVMSGTSADGVDVALVQIGESSGQVSRSHTIKLLGHMQFPYQAKLRDGILAAMNANGAKVADLARLNFLLGELYADAVLATQRRYRVKADLVGCHGQTLYHQGDAQSFLGRKVAATWQTGEAAVIAARVGVPVVSDFRPADMAAGGKGAPLVPYLDYLWFRDARIGRIVQNLGGIANLTAIPPGARSADVVAFDTGPGNMVIDAVTRELFGKPFDRGGKIAASGEVIEPVLNRIMRLPYFRAKPPKTTGREEFGREFVGELLRSCRGSQKQDVVATATALTATSIAEAVTSFVRAGSPKIKVPTPSTPLRAGLSHKTRQGRGNQKRARFREIILSGGGSRNATLVGMLAELLSPMGIVVRFSDEFGLPSEAKEAVAFAVLAYQTWHRRASNVPSATGARRAAVLGKISYA